MFQWLRSLHKHRHQHKAKHGAWYRPKSVSEQCQTIQTRKMYQEIFLCGPQHVQKPVWVLISESALNPHFLGIIVNGNFGVLLKFDVTFSNCSQIHGHNMSLYVFSTVLLHFIITHQFYAFDAYLRHVYWLSVLQYCTNIMSFIPLWICCCPYSSGVINFQIDILLV
jgi:hypothetical protein